MQIKDVIESIPLILQYFIPGYIAVLVFRFLTSRKSDDSQSGIIISAVISYTLISITEIFTANMNSINNSVLMKSGVAIIIGFVGTILCAFVFRTKLFSMLLVQLFNKTPNDDIWMDIIDFKKGSNLKIYERGKNYYITGHHYINEEKGNDSWFAITAYSKTNIESNEVFEDHSKDDMAILAVRLSDVDHIEIFNYEG